jgi:hypothetical protein
MVYDQLSQQNGFWKTATYPSIYPSIHPFIHTYTEVSELQGHLDVCIGRHTALLDEAFAERFEGNQLLVEIWNTD